VSNRWERLLEQKPVPLREHLLDEVARSLAGEWRNWPLPVAEVDHSTPAAQLELLSGRAPRPPPEVYAEALKLTRWDIERAHQATDDYFRNQRYRAAGVVDADKPVLLLLNRWLLEQLLSLGEATEGRLKRSDLATVLERLTHTLSGPG
jgi:hypothetical protein